MTNFIGEYECKLDVKGRLMLPSGLRKQLDAASEEKFVMNRGFEKCLVLYPKNDWKYISEEVNKLNQYVKKNREFIRYFYRGATEMALDGTGRLLFPKRMLEYAGVEKEVVLFAYGNRIEVWDKETYNGLLTDEPDEFANLAEEVMGGSKNQDEEDVS
ncbi:MAG: division/cell wall cluster transcriptional repressor MraZ [Flavobacteriales bacterium]|nr:division/cell wall cluster transcriptional repressor MraZ [Flavobacteriales bacterium]